MSRGDALARLTRALEDHGSQVRGGSAQCPAHEDRDPSLSVSQGKAGAVLHCHAGCDADAVLKALGMSAADLFDNPREERRDGEWTPRGAAIAIYDYTDEHGTLLFQVCRTAGKHFAQRVPDRTAKSGWRWQLRSTRRVPYRLPELLGAAGTGATVYVAEGEKDVDALVSAGAVATCNPGGAGKWRAEYARHFAGIAKVIVVADRDGPGRAHAARVAGSLRGVVAEVEVAESAAGKDAADHLAAGHGLGEFMTASPGQPDHDDQAGEPRRSWRPVDLTAILAGTSPPAMPTVGRRDDGAGLFYPGRTHIVAAEAEAGKTWLALAAIAVELNDGHTCVFIDFEDDAAATVGRLVTMGVGRHALGPERFAYIRPDDPLDLYGNKADLVQVLGDLKPALVVLDGVTEAMTMHGLELRDNSDVARFARMLPRWIASRGPAAVALDHVVKDREGRNGHALGGVHKLNAVDGAMYVLEPRDPFGIGLPGRSRLLVKKDRPGQLRRRARPAHDGLFWYADLVIDSHGDEFADVSVPPPPEQPDEPWVPTEIMTRLSQVLAATPGGLSKNGVEGAIRGKAATVRYALEKLIDGGYVTVEPQGHAKVCKHARPYPDG